MPVETSSQFLDAAYASRLLDADQLEELVRRPEAASGDLPGLGAFLVESGWLTPYQVDRIRAGDGERLIFLGYRVLDKVGEGSGGVVLKAVYPALKRPVAVRQIRREWLAAPDTVDDYVQRAQAASLVSHPHLVNVLDAGVAEDVPFVVHEYVVGTDLASLVQELGVLPTPLACEYVRQAADALHAAHLRGVLHGDLQPKDCIVTPVLPPQLVDGRPRGVARPAPGAAVKVKDVGLNPRRPSLAELVQRSGNQLLQIDYFPPERIDRPDPDVRSDVYGLGAVLFFLLVGRSPYAGVNPVDTFRKMLQGDAVPLEQVRPDVPEAIRDLLRDALARNPLQRPPTAQAFADRLRPFANAPTPNDTPPPLAEPVSRVGPQSNAPLPVPSLGSPPALPEADPLANLHGGSSTALPRQFVRREGPAKSSRLLWILLGGSLHALALTLLVLWAMGVFSSTPPPPPPATRPLDEKPGKTYPKPAPGSNPAKRTDSR